MEVSGLYFAPWQTGSTRLSITLIPEIGVQFGSETYKFSANVPTSTGLDASVSSKLSYPVSGAVGGGTVLFGLGRLSLGVSVLTNIGDPWGTLLDQDFLTVNDGAGSQTVEFSHTDSPTTLRTIGFESAVRYRLGAPAVKKEMAVHAVAGFHFESITYDAYGASGWQLDADGNQVFGSIPDSPHGLHYEVHYRQPFIGIGADAGNDSSLFSGEARLIASWSSHDDDHLLRHKLAHASAFGGGVGFSASWITALGGGRSLRLFAGLGGELQAVASFSGRLKQHYYGDDPSLDGDQTNAVIPDADFSFLSVRVRLLLFLAARF
jgi:hypothetical protein